MTNAFLETIIPKQCEAGDYFILSVKGGNIKWLDVPFKYRSEKQLKTQLNDFFETYPPQDYDLYFCPVTYSGNRRRKADANDTKYLWQDIDENAKPEEIDPKPTYIWESSPNKYQGLWEIDRYIEPQVAEVINKNLSKKIGADDCYDIGHVLRIPGTINHKYKNHPPVAEAEDTKTIWRYKTLHKQLEGIIKEKKESEKADGKSKALDPVKIINKYKISGKLLDTLTAKEAEEGRRSDIIWYLENALFDKGLEIPEIISLIKNSVWNKYKGRPDEDTRLRKEAEKVLEKGFEEGTSLARIKMESKPFKVDTYSDVMSNMNTFPGWLVEGFWGRRSHGIVAGQPKVFKSTYVHDLAISVASGEPFLGQYPVQEQGPVIVVQNENADWLMKDRTEKMIVSKNLVGRCKTLSDKKLRITWADDLPIHFINQQGFNLDNLDHQQQIEELIKEVKPVLVIFDPLYLMFGGDLNSAKELNPVLNWLLEVKIKYKTGVMVVHHYNKGTADNRGGQKMLGSVALHGWVESAWYLRRNADQKLEADHTAGTNAQVKDPTEVILEREFRTAGGYPELKLGIQMGQFGDPYYNVDVEIYEPQEKEDNFSKNKAELVKEGILTTLRNAAYPLNKKELTEQLRPNLSVKVSDRMIKSTLDELLFHNQIHFQNGKGYYIDKE